MEPLAAVLGVLLVLFSFVAFPARTLAWEANTFSPSDEALLFNLTNQARASAGLAPLRDSAALHSLAEWRSKDMATRDYFSHQIPPQGYLVFHYMDAQGIKYVLAGENIGWDNAPDEQATQMIQQMFMNSPEHRANILGAKWDSMGVGAYKASDGKVYYTVLFMESAPVATPAPTRPPTPRPTRAPTPPPTQRPVEHTSTPRPATPTPHVAAATPTPTPAPTATPGATPVPTLTPEPATPAPATPPASPSAPPAQETSVQPASLRVVQTTPPGGLLDQIVGPVLASFLGS